VDPNKRGNPPFEPSSYAAGLERRVKRMGEWITAARVYGRDMIDGSPIEREAAEQWWRMQFAEPEVVLSDDPA
jgi:hypothetical protein